MNIYVGGKFDDNGGRPSKIAQQVFEAVKSPGMEYHNGGHFLKLEEIISNIGDYKKIYWFADIPNEKEKLVKEIKKNNNSCILITSKNNTAGKYSFADLVSRALSDKSNLVLEFIKDEDKRFRGRIIDPLGNVFLDYNEDFSLVGETLKKRTEELESYTRVPSYKVGEKVNIPEKERFFSLIRDCADRFHELINANNNNNNKERFLGNASFRCERGVPSFNKEGLMKEELIYVSRRNVDKRFLGGEGFLGVKQELPVQYFGDVKPSVDTPIQVRLYQHYNNLRYMLHGHVYIKDAPFTKAVIPCGAMEEADEIIKIFPNPEDINIAINLRGHGSLLLADNIKFLKKASYIARKTPEVQG